MKEKIGKKGCISRHVSLVMLCFFSTAQLAPVGFASSGFHQAPGKRHLVRSPAVGVDPSRAAEKEALSAGPNDTLAFVKNNVALSAASETSIEVEAITIRNGDAVFTVDPKDASGILSIGISGLHEVNLAFTGEINVTKDDLSLKGLKNSSYSFTGFEVNGTTATWTLEEVIEEEQLYLELSGDHTFRFRFNLLPGDVTGDHQMDPDDIIHILAAGIGYPYTQGDATLSQGDVTGDGNFDESDLDILKAHYLRDQSEFADLAPPTGSIVINDGELETNTPLVHLTLTAEDPDSEVIEMSFSVDGGNTFTDFEPFQTSKQVTLTGEDGGISYF